MTGPWSTVDPDGRTVILTEERWQHIEEGHPELTDFRELVLRAVSEPMRRVRRANRRGNEEWFYLATFRPSRWLKVVVVFDTLGVGRIMTAFPRRRTP